MLRVGHVLLLVLAALDLASASECDADPRCDTNAYFEIARNIGVETEYLAKFLESFENQKPIERIGSLDFSSKEFFERYASLNRPVVVRSDAVPRLSWNRLQEILTTHEAIEDLVQFGRFDASNTKAWAGMSPAANSDRVTIPEFIEKVQRGAGDLQILDFSVLERGMHFAFQDVIKIPKFFRNDFFKRIECSWLGPISWPSLFVAPEGTESGLHQDGYASHFWMGVANGAKLFRIFDIEETKYLLPTDRNLQAEDLEDWARRGISLHYALVQPGDIVFVPSEWPHKVNNLKSTIAFSGNVIDKSNINRTNDLYERGVTPSGREFNRNQITLFNLFRKAGEEGDHKFHNEDIRIRDMKDHRKCVKEMYRVFLQTLKSNKDFTTLSKHKRMQKLMRKNQKKSKKGKAEL